MNNPSADNTPEVIRTEKQCIACRGTIHPEATICPHCRLPQSPQRWKSFAAALKWIGGTAALVSLVIGSFQLNNLLKSTRERSRTVGEWVRAADLQVKVGDLPGALQVIEQALELESGSKEAREKQLDIAMTWVRQFTGFEWRRRGFNEEDYRNILDPLIPILYRGTAHSDPAISADVMAHIGWANHLRNLSGSDEFPVMPYFKSSLNLDSGNVYAHTMWATACLTTKKSSTKQYIAECKDPVETAQGQFELALKSDPHREYVLEARLLTLLGTEKERAVAELLKLLNEMCKNDATLSQERAVLALSEVIATVMPSFGSHYEPVFENLEELAGSIPISELTATFDWLLNHCEERHRKNRKFQALRSLSLELAGKHNQALESYKTIRQKMLNPESNQPGDYDLQIEIDRRIAHILKIRTGLIGLSIENMTEQQAKRHGLDKPIGILVKKVVPKGPADLAGIAKEDLLLEVNGIELDTEGRLLSVIIRGSLPGDKLVATVLRNGFKQSINVVLAEGEISVDIPREAMYRQFLHATLKKIVDRTFYHTIDLPLPAGSHPWNGVRLADLTPELRGSFDLTEEVEGVLVLRDLDRRWAMTPGNVILKFDGQPVRKAEEVANLLARAISSGRESIQCDLMAEGVLKTIDIELVQKKSE